MDNFWKAALKVGGVATIGGFIFFGLYEAWLKLSIFSEMNAEQTFILMVIFLGLPFFALIVFVIAFVKLRRKKKPKIQQNVSGNSIGAITTGDSAEIKITK